MHVSEALRPYLAVVGARYRMLLQYRAAAFAGFGTQLFWGSIKLMILGAFFSVSTADVPMSLPEVVVYVWLGQALLGLLPWTVDPELQEKMLSGGVAYELLKPVDLYGFWFARTLALRTATTTLRSAPMFLVAGLVLPWLGLDAWALSAPPSWGSALAFVASITATVVLASAITMVLHVALIWTLSGRGFNAMMAGVVMFFSGMIVPLPLFPDWLQPLLYWQPFRGLADVPFRIYSGHIAVNDAGLEILLQLGWTAIIVAIGHAVLGHAQRRLVVQGG